MTQKPRMLPTQKFDLNSITKVYLAGPIAKNDWRHALVHGLREKFSEDEEARARSRYDTTTALPMVTPGYFSVGPWFYGCDHGCGHGVSTHGAGNECLPEVFAPELHHAEIFSANMKRLQRADAVFAYIDRDAAYGTMFELGFAFAKGIPAFIAFPPNAAWEKDMWFAAQSGVDPLISRIASVNLAWDAFCGWWQRRKRRAE